MRDKDGRVLVNAHVLGTFSNGQFTVCKVLNIAMSSLKVSYVG